MGHHWPYADITGDWGVARFLKRKVDQNLAAAARSGLATKITSIANSNPLAEAEHQSEPFGWASSRKRSGCIEAAAGSHAPGWQRSVL
jgi:hypothetical protein